MTTEAHQVWLKQQQTKNRRVRVTWLVIMTLATFLYVLKPSDEAWVLPALVILWGFTALAFTRLRRYIGLAAQWLRWKPTLYWFILLVYLCLTLGYWVVNRQPTYGRWLTSAEFIYLLLCLWGLVYLVAYDLDEEQTRDMGTKLGKSKLTGVLITLTTIVLIFIGAETWMRLFYVTTDAYTFTAMNYHWYNNFYWGHYNSVGYRDHEPIPDAQTRIAVLGDSFAAGHGIDNIDDTFPQLLEQRLGAGYDVDLIANSGWDTDVELGYLDAYPYRPNIVILSYYLNDIQYLIRYTSISPDSNFNFPQNPTLNWIVLNFFVPNYIYYNLLQFTSPTRNHNHTADMVSAYTDDQYWLPQAERLTEIVNWTRDHDARLIVLLWPQIAMIDDSQPAVTRVRDLFESQGVEVVDMSDPLRGYDTSQLIVNRFDTHPSITAHRLAADALYPLLVGQ
ncbi:MAG: SGNH/GDSL hydrolase family protein [Anaerolineae bacterium]